MIFSSVSSQQLSAIPRVCTGSTGGGPSSMMGCSSMTLAPPFSRGMPRSPAVPGSAAPPSPPFSGRARGAARLGPLAAPCQQADVMVIGPQRERVHRGCLTAYGAAGWLSRAARTRRSWYVFVHSAGCLSLEAGIQQRQPVQLKSSPCHQGQYVCTSEV